MNQNISSHSPNIATVRLRTGDIYRTGTGKRYMLTDFNYNKDEATLESDPSQGRTRTLNLSLRKIANDIHLGTLVLHANVPCAVNNGKSILIPIPHSMIGSPFSIDDEDIGRVSPRKAYEMMKEREAVKPRCSHQWKGDTFFTSKVYYTCSKCGAKREDT